MRILDMRILYFIIGIIILLIFVIKKIENKMIFVPTKLDKDENMNNDYHQQQLRNSINDDVTTKEYFVKSTGGKLIHAIDFNNPNTRNHILFCHGNAGNIKGRYDVFQSFGKLASITIFDYQGYGKSMGIPSEQNVYDDAYNMWKHLINKKMILPHNITIYGKSLGGAIASHLTNKLCNTSNQNIPHSLIIDSSFCDVRTISKDLMPSFCGPLIDLCMTCKFDSKNNILNICDKMKILITHSTDDTMIGLKHAKILLKYTNNKARLLKTTGSHNNIDYNDQYIDTLKSFLKN
jgi:hypothetical protein